MNRRQANDAKKAARRATPEPNPPRRAVLVSNSVGKMIAFECGVRLDSYNREYNERIWTKPAPNKPFSASAGEPSARQIEYFARRRAEALEAKA